jgi:hypothetical protein
MPVRAWERGARRGVRELDLEPLGSRRGGNHAERRLSPVAVITACVLALDSGGMSPGTEGEVFGERDARGRAGAR